MDFVSTIHIYSNINAENGTVTPPQSEAEFENGPEKDILTPVSRPMYLKTIMSSTN